MVQQKTEEIKLEEVKKERDKRNALYKLRGFITILEVVSWNMADLYDKYPELNEWVCISNLIPTSLGDWNGDIQEWLEQN